jgi:hypothetical protein
MGHLISSPTKKMGILIFSTEAKTAKENEHIFLPSQEYVIANGLKDKNTIISTSNAFDFKSGKIDL